MACKHPKDVELVPIRPFPDEGSHHAELVTPSEQRKASGDLPDQPPDNPVIDSIPFANLRSA
jgi:hypothetical protein